MIVYSADKCMVRWAKPNGAFERVGCNLRLFNAKYLVNFTADPAGFDLDMISLVPPS